MPWHIVPNHAKCSKPFAVVKDDDGSVSGCHDSRASAERQLAALYASEEEMSVKTEELGGKPNPGTKPDKRLSDNDGCPDGQRRSRTSGHCEPIAADVEDHETLDEEDVETFHPGHANQSVHGGKGGKKPPQMKKVPRLSNPGDVARYKKAQAKERKEARADAERARRQTQERRQRRRGGGPVARDVGPGAGRGRASLEDIEVFDDDGLSDEAIEQGLRALTGPLVPWEGVLAVEGVETGDGREFAPGSLEWPDTEDIILPLMWQEASEPAHGKSIVVGRIEHIERMGDEILGRGVVLADAKVTEQMRLGVAGGVSVDVDSVKNVDVEFVYSDEAAGAEKKDDILALLAPKPDKMIFHRGRLRGATLVALPAFVQARLRLIDEEGDALVAAAIPIDPPSEWFNDPQLSGPTPWTVTDDGQVFGHMALWSSCHQTFMDRCVTPPRERDFPYFMRRELKTMEGDVVGVGPITMGTSHANTRLGARPAAEHYDNTGTAVVDITCGEDKYGIWIAGALRPTVTATQLRELRGAALSGDWRRIGGQLRLVAVLAVNVPGFPIPRMRSRIDDQQASALVAAGIVTDDRIDQLADAEADLIEDNTIRIVVRRPVA